MVSSGNESTDKEEVPSKKTKFCRGEKYKTAANKEWLMMKSTKIFLTTEKLILFTLSIVLYMQRMLLLLIKV